MPSLLTRCLAAKVSTPAIVNTGADGYANGLSGSLGMVTDLTANRTLGASLMREEHRNPFPGAYPFLGNLPPLMADGAADRQAFDGCMLVEFAPLGSGTRTFRTWQVLEPPANNTDLVKIAQGLGQLANSLDTFAGPGTIAGMGGTGYNQLPIYLPSQPSNAAMPGAPNPGLAMVIPPG